MTPLLNASGEPTEVPSNAPWWVKTISVVGVPAAIALYLVYVLSNGAVTAITNIDTNVKTHAAAEATHDHEQRESSSRMENYLRLLCLNTAKTNSDRNTCLSVR